MSVSCKGLILLLTLPLWAADEKGSFKPGPASSFARHQTIEKVTIAAMPYTTDEQTKSAFGKVNPNDYGILPVLVVIQNDSGQSVKLDSMIPEYVTADQSRIEPTPARDLPYLQGPKRPSNVPSPLPKLRDKKHPLAAFEIEQRAFSAKMLPPGESAFGFLYFRAKYRDGSSVYFTGLKNAGTGKDLFYFEIPLERP